MQKIKNFTFIIILVIVVLCCGGVVRAVDNSALIAQLQAQIANLVAQIQAILSQQATSQTWCYTFNNNLGFANSGTNEVAQLHIALQKQNLSFSPDIGNIYSQGTVNGVVAFQKKYGLLPATGYTGVRTRAKLNSLYGCSSNVNNLTVVNGICGSANGTINVTIPTINLCAVGTTSTVSGNGPWTWTCSGSNGGITSICSASIQTSATVNGICGSANGTTVTSAPTYYLCSTGTASTVSGTGPWTWTCAGSNGGTADSCYASKTNSLPSDSLTCTPNWQCASWDACYNGQQARYCYDLNYCGSTVGQPTDTQACSSNCTPNWQTSSWSACTNSQQTRTVTDSNYCGITAGQPATTQACSTAVNGVCGLANGTIAISAPFNNLCSTGTASTVSGTGPWTWTCAGSNGGTAVNCSASNPNTPVNGSCGSANGVAITSSPAANLCSFGTASAVTSPLNWAWTCIGSGGGTTANCNAPRNVSCGLAAKTYTYNEAFPAGSYCSFGSNSAPNNPIPGGSSTWTCQGSGTGSTTTCTATRTTDPSAISGVCGSANGTLAGIIPTNSTELCYVGTPSVVSADVGHPSWAPPWNWTCAGSAGGATANCATIIAGQKSDYSYFCTVQGYCEAYHPVCNDTRSLGYTCDETITSIIQDPPTQPCYIGVPTSFTYGLYNNGFWLWKCKSPDGTASVDCKTQRYVTTPGGYCS